MLIDCPCGTEMDVPNWKVKSGKGKYCSNPCKYKYRYRPSGLSYNIVNDNLGWVKPGQHLSPETEFQPGIRNNPLGEFKPGERVSLSTEFKSGKEHPYWQGGYKYSPARHAAKHSVEDRYNQFARQNGCCAICGSVPLRRLDVDHDHKSGALRGLLCNPCNRGLGHFKDNPELLIKAANYLKSKGVWGEV